MKVGFLLYLSSEEIRMAQGDPPIVGRAVLKMNISGQSHVRGVVQIRIAPTATWNLRWRKLAASVEFLYWQEVIALVAAKVQAGFQKQVHSSCVQLYTITVKYWFGKCWLSESQSNFPISHHNLNLFSFYKLFCFSFPIAADSCAHLFQYFTCLAVNHAEPTDRVLTY